MQIENKVDIADKATSADVEAGTSDEKWMTPARTKQMVQNNKVLNVDGTSVTFGKNNLIPPSYSSRLYRTNSDLFMTSIMFETTNYYVYKLTGSSYSSWGTAKVLIVGKTGLSTWVVTTSFGREFTPLGLIPLNTDDFMIFDKTNRKLIYIRVSYGSISIIYTYNSSSMDSVTSSAFSSKYFYVVGPFGGSNKAVYGTYNNINPTTKIIPSTTPALVNGPIVIKGDYIIGVAYSYSSNTFTSFGGQWIELINNGSGNTTWYSNLSISNASLRYIYDGADESAIVTIGQKQLIIHSFSNATLSNIPGSYTVNSYPITFPYIKRAILHPNVLCRYSPNGLDAITILNTPLGGNVGISAIGQSYQIIDAFGNVYSSSGTFQSTLDTNAPLQGTLLSNGGADNIDTLVLNNRYSSTIVVVHFRQSVEVSHCWFLSYDKNLKSFIYPR